MNSGGAWAISFKRRGAEVEFVWNSVGRPWCFDVRNIGREASRSASCIDGLFLDLNMDLALESLSDFLTLRVCAEEDWIADFTRGRISSSTRLGSI